MHDCKPLTPVLVRPMRAADEQAVAELAALAFQPLRRVYRPRAGPPASPPTADADAGRWVATVDGRLVGTVRGRVAPPRLHLIGLAVHPCFQRRGIARRIVEHLAGLARQRNLACLSLYTIRQTDNAPIFERLGFQLVREAPVAWAESPVGDALSELYMERSVLG